MPRGTLPYAIPLAAWAVSARVALTIHSPPPPPLASAPGGTELFASFGGSAKSRRKPAPRNGSGDEVWVNYDNMVDIHKIPVFAFDHENHGHMQSMVLDWGRLYELSVEVALYGTLDVDPVRKAFQFIRQTRPKLALWLLPFRNGDPDRILPELGDFFEASHRDTRHGVFHWPPEMCDEHDCTVDACVHAYKHADFVFQFGYQDERLSRLDPEKFLAWPLGPAWWKGWKTPILPPPLRERRNLAAFRGAWNTHGDYDRLKAFAGGMEGVVIEDSGKWIGRDNASSAQRYQELLATSKYAISLAGRNPNCYRIFEAVLTGSIPMLFVKDGMYGCYDNWAAVYGNPIHTEWAWIPRSPFEVMGNVSELPAKLHEVSSKAVDELGQELDAWYSAWRHSFRYKLVQKLEAALAH